MSEDKRLVFPENGGRNAAYQAQLEDIHRKGICPFCPEHLEEYKKGEILRRGKHWVVVKVTPAYKGSVAHLAGISVPHITLSTELTAEAQLEIFEHVTWMVGELKLTHWSFIMRSGGAESGATVAHLHFHVASAGSENILTRIG